MGSLDCGYLALIGHQGKQNLNSRLVGGERYLSKPTFILVREKTFSLAEKFAYSMKHSDKAAIIGQASAGAAHAINFL